METWTYPGYKSVRVAYSVGLEGKKYVVRTLRESAGNDNFMMEKDTYIEVETFMKRMGYEKE